MKTHCLALAAIVLAASVRADEPKPDRRLDALRVTLTVQEAPFDLVLDRLREVTRLTIAVHPEARDSGPDAPRVSLDLRDIPLRLALKHILRPRGLAVQEVEGALMIVPQRVIDEVTTFKTYDVRDLLTRRPDFAAPEMALKTGNPGQGFG